jgi:tricorn protease-like protein
MKKILTVLITMIFCFTPLAGCANNNLDKGKSDLIRNISFSPDGKKIIFDRKKDDKSFMIHLYDLTTGELSAYRSPAGEDWTMARCSFDGKRIAFTITPHIGEKWDIANSQIAVMAPDGRNVKKITNTTGFKVDSSFSHDGKKIIYVRAGRIRKEGKTAATDYDIYEVDLETGKETRLTWYKFYMMSMPYYYPDDEKIIFSAYGPPSMFPDIAENDDESIRIRQAELNAKSLQIFKTLGDNIYVIKKGQKELPEPFIKSKDGLRRPLLTKNGTIFFQIQANKPGWTSYWNQFFQYSADGKHRCITNLKATSIWSAAISNDGALLAIVYGDSAINNIVIYQVKDGSSREITLPDQPSRIINSQ